MTPANILIVTNGALCRNPRPLKEATSLAAAGYSVTVLTVRNHERSEQSDLKLLAEARFGRIAIEMRPGTGTRSFLLRLEQKLAREAARRMRVQIPSALGPVRALLHAARRHSADLTLVHNEAPHWVGTRLLRDGRRVAADFEDWHSEDLLPADRAARPLELLRSVERALLQHAAYVTVPSNAMAKGLHERYGGHPAHRLVNAFPLQPHPRTSTPRNGPPAFFWFSQTLGPGRGLEAFLRAWSVSRLPSRLVLLGESVPGYRDALRQLAAPARRPDLKFRDLEHPSRLPELIAQHDIGLALEPASPANKDLTISNKILQYLNAGLAVLASPTAGQREVLDSAPLAGMTAALERPQVLAEAIDTMLTNPGELTLRQRAARSLAEEIYCWEREAPKLLELVGRSLMHGRSPQS